MKLIELYAEEFGCLENRRFSLGEGLTLIEGANESGKSTLQALIRFLFYGFPRRGGEEGDERYKRISHKTHRAAGSVTFSWHGARYFLSRDYILHTSGGREMPAERVAVIKDDGKAVDLGGKSPGEYFLLLPVELYHGSVCVRQSEIERVSDPETGHMVEELLFSDMGGARLERAEKILDEARRALWHNRGTGGKISELEAELASLEAARAAASEDAARLERLRREISCLHKSAEERVGALGGAMQMAEAALLDQELARLDAWHAARTDAEEKLDAWRSVLGGSGEPRHPDTQGGVDAVLSDARRIARKKRLFATVFAFFAMLAALFASGVLSDMGVLLRLAGAIGAMIITVLFALLWQKAARALRALCRRFGAKTPKMLGAVLVHRENEARLRYESAKSAVTALENGLDVANESALRARRATLPAPNADRAVLDDRCARLREDVRVVGERLAAAEREEIALSARVLDPAVLLARKNEVLSALTGAKNRLAAIKMATEALGEAHGALRDGVLPRLCARATELFEVLTNGRWHSLHIGDRFALSVGTPGGPLPLSHFSAGCRDAAYFALRVALTELITREPLPLLLDEVTARLDDTRAASLLAMLESFAAGGGQCVLFTCHTREAKMLNGESYTHIVL